MPLVLRIENVDTLPDGGPLHFELDRRGIDIGRDSYLDWTLPDAQRYISGKHCEIRYRDGGYWLHDVSTNGTTINDEAGRLTGPHRLADGDRIHVGHYIIAATVDVAVDAPVGAPPPAADPGGTGSADPWGGIEDAADAVPRRQFRDASRGAPPPEPDLGEENIAWSIGETTPAPMNAGEIDWNVTPPAGDPWGADGGGASPASAAPPPDPFADPGPSASSPGGDAWATEATPSEDGDAAAPVFPGPQPGDSAPSPRAAPDAPDQPLNDLTGSSSTPADDDHAPQPAPDPGQAAPGSPPPEERPAEAPPQAAAFPPLETAAPAPAQPQASPAPPAGDSPFIRAFERGAGLPEGAVAAASDTAFAETLGALMRKTAAELQAMLLARAETKSAMRSAERTMIGAAENNPLKFSPTAEDALRLMFGPETRSYLDAAATLDQSFADLQAHQLQTFAAMQGALQALIGDLDPQRIAEATAKEGGLAGMVGSHRARLWDIYVERFSAMAGRHERGMVDAFMVLFAEMYDRQR